jgi:hypothetical protein
MKAHKKGKVTDRELTAKKHGKAIKTLAKNIKEKRKIHR